MDIKSVNREILENKGIEDISIFLDSLEEMHYISNSSWDTHSYKPDVSFRIAYSEDRILLKFYVTEREIRADIKKDNQNVFEDSCVEFFFLPENTNNYYNFEFNCLGAALVGYGAGRENRTLLDLDLIGEIQRSSNIKNDYSWELCVIIPSSIFVYNSFKYYSGMICNANFYKCGDKHEIPHYVSWQKIDTAEPDFHRPDFFKEIHFS